MLEWGLKMLKILTSTSANICCLIVFLISGSQSHVNCYITCAKIGGG